MTYYELITHKVNLLYIAFAQARCTTMKEVWARKLESMREHQDHMPVDIAGEMVPLRLVR